MTYIYQDKNRFFAQTAPGLEEATAEELAALGAANIEAQFMGVAFCADKAALYRANYECRLVSRVLAPLIDFPYQTENDLYHHALTLKWTDFLKPHQTFAVYATRSKNSQSRHTG